MKKYLILGLAATCLFIYVLKCEASESKPLWVEVKHIIQDEVIIITAPHDGPWYLDPTPLFIIGIQKISGRYIIKSITPITEEYDHGSRTSSIILLVEKRKNIK